ncbi:type I 3-dehydroquinate dehydratase [Dietzia sp. PP-33]|jgi:3-dehydroquinate dehydratase-1|uniref:type I 3-dehydroquinate dehydratase n=1 Tax=Dietzia sp. PP-33 TaxID=2957500 RepID=UPI0029B98C98|nr:type I 3-dehydroquinate dehydratase [Dietzia sp. PP-33]MDX2356433.1 type I 3-dehydroquinate dehydratase [Dietzia sp. PP-33]
MTRPRLTLDASSPSIIVPLTGRDLVELEGQIDALHAAAELFDVVEWRVDLFEPFTAGVRGEPSPAVGALERISELLPGRPILATFRTRAEGGGAQIPPEAYVALVEALASTGLAAAIDVEYRHPLAGDAIAAVHGRGIPVVASNHDFDSTPSAEELTGRLAAMEDAGADVAKIAVTPRSAADVVTLLTATEQRFRVAAIPLITMSMGGLGAVTRLGGGVFGSAATFATVGAASAPGQLPAEGVRRALDLLGGKNG